MTNDRNFLLDRLLKYENISESDSTDCTDGESDNELLTNDKQINKPTNDSTTSSTTKK